MKHSVEENVVGCCATAELFKGGLGDNGYKEVVDIVGMVMGVYRRFQIDNPLLPANTGGMVDISGFAIELVGVLEYCHRYFEAQGYTYNYRDVEVATDPYHFLLSVLNELTLPRIDFYSRLYSVADLIAGFIVEVRKNVGDQG